MRLLDYLPQFSVGIVTMLAVLLWLEKDRQSKEKRQEQREE
jgi:hypothetical protein